ncbi:diguanylate cyclase domain-containing protein [Butyrivibrio proteoclasticus]|uniref:diguanylate cyclase domain-containing protein n=1 Tax=Butyrivibrio proteoclasticus TaxID=43305 RepID=UPI000478AE2F|nr:diguanylate cyclase [Butyrivibrio proteoclasticus]
MSKKKSITIGLIAFVLALAVTTVLAIMYLSYTASSRRERATFIVNSVADQIEAKLQARDSVTRFLEIGIKGNDGAMTIQEFQSIGQYIFNDYIDIVNISIAPQGVVSYVYPMEGGIAERKNIFEDSLEGPYADNSKLSGLPIIICPMNLEDGSYGLIIRRPIYLGEDTNEESFWGFSSVTIGLSAFLSETNIKGLSEQGYEYKLTGINPISGDSRIIMEYSEKELSSPVEAMISTVGGNYWTLSIAPSDNWMNLWEILSAFAIAIVISGLFSFAASSYTSMKANAKELEVLSYRDALTNLNNPRSYHEHMDELSKKKLPYGLIFMDLNDFKKVNDTYGHDAGDALLNIVAKRLQNSIREKDRAFRIGGDEFVVVIHGNHDKKFYEGVIARMRQNVAREVTIGEVTLNVSISAGFARCPEDGTKFEDVVKKADDAMYYNKRLMKAKRMAAEKKS